MNENFFVLNVGVYAEKIAQISTANAPMKKIYKGEKHMEKNNKNEEFKEKSLEKNSKNEQTINRNKNNKSWITLRIIIVIAIVGFIVYAIYNMINNIAYKPIIYLYPEEEMQISVKLGRKEKITCSYPEYKDGWNVIAKTDGTLVDVKTGRNLYALYWEGIHSEKCDLTEGFVVARKDTISFLEEKLEQLGLNERESEEFIVYWLPRLQENKYNYIRFATMEEINKNMPLEFSVEPDTLIRVLMQYKKIDKYIEVKEQKLETPERKGFTVVEWGGTEIK